MNNYRPINTGEGELYLDPGYDCPSPFNKLRYCDCGAISFLDGPCRKCGNTAMKPVSKALRDQFHREMREESKYQLLLLVMSIVLAVLYVVFMMVVIANYEAYGIGSVQKVIMIGAAVMILSLCIMDIFVLFETKKNQSSMRTYKFGEQVIEAFELAYAAFPDNNKEGAEKKTWFNTFLAGYLEDINFLYRQFNAALKSGQREEQLSQVYNSALKLSYVLDNQALAELRLHCLKEIGLHRNSHCDIEQILHVLRAEYFRKKPEMMYLVEMCLESYSEPLSYWTVCCLMHDLKYFMPDSETELSQKDRELVKKCLVHCSGGKVIWFIRKNPGNEWRMLTNCFLEVRQENEVFNQQAAVQM